MLVTIEPGETAEGANRQAGVPRAAQPGRDVPGPADHDAVYDLRLGQSNSDGFYAEAARFSDQLLEAIEERAASLLDGYGDHVLGFLREAERSRGEYALDLLTLGMVLRRYAGAAESTPWWAVALARELYWLRHRSTWAKPAVDLARAAIGRFFLAPAIGRQAERPPAREGLPRLIGWLQATGEFEQEIRRLNNWRSFLDTLPQPAAARALDAAVDVFNWFQQQADIALGAYTRGVPRFLATEHARRGIREDAIFCGRPPVEYHLAMVAAELMNRGMRERFAETAAKAVLVPACMRGEHARTCKARTIGTDITCSGCDPACAVNRITIRMRRLGAKVYLVPHSTGFSQWLARWQREPETGVVAAACLLNILPGGYEMRARRIPSQCVLLDFPGCQKHWRREGIPTQLNEERLVRIATACHPA